MLAIIGFSIICCVFQNAQSHQVMGEFLSESFQNINRRLDNMEMSCQAQDSMKQAITKLQADVEQVRGLAIRLNQTLAQLQVNSSKLQTGVDVLDAMATESEKIQKHLLVWYGQLTFEARQNLLDEVATPDSSEQITKMSSETITTLETKEYPEKVMATVVEDFKIENETQAKAFQTSNSRNSTNAKQASMSKDEFSLLVIRRVSVEYANFAQWPISQINEFNRLVVQMGKKTQKTIAEILNKEVSEIPNETAQLTQYLGQISDTMSPIQVKRLRDETAKIRDEYAQDLIQAFNWSEADIGVDLETFCTYVNTCSIGN